MQHLHGARILVIEDDPSTAEYVIHVLEKLGGCTVDHFSNPAEGAAAIDSRHYDGIVTDVMLPGFDGIEFLKRSRTKHPDTPVIVMTAYATVDVAVDAVQHEAAGFLRKPFSSQDLLERLDAQIASRRPLRRRVLAIGAHPDDVEIGAGATLAAHARAGDEVVIGILTRGFEGGDGPTRSLEAEAAADILGATVHFGDLHDTRIPEGGPSVQFIERLVEDTKPDIVYTHSSNDVHQDHRSTHRASLVAARRIPTVYCYQSPSATVAFAPSRFTDISDHLAAKLEVVAAHASQATKRSYMDPELITATGRYWGRFGDSTHAEAFEVVRDLATGGAAHVAA